MPDKRLHERNKSHHLEELCAYNSGLASTDNGNLFNGFTSLKRLHICFDNEINIDKVMICDCISDNIHTLEYIGIECKCHKYEEIKNR